MTDLTDKIAQVLRDRHGGPFRDVAEAVVSVVTAHTTVDTVDELDALPVGTVVRDARGHVCERWSFVGSLGWLRTGEVQRFWHITSPVTVLFRPDGGES